jgi:hypothetical protein
MFNILTLQTGIKKVNKGKTVFCIRKDSILKNLLILSFPCLRALPPPKRLRAGRRSASALRDGSGNPWGFLNLSLNVILFDFIGSI